MGTFTCWRARTISRTFRWRKGAISANGTWNGIVWLIETKAWNGADRAARDRVGRTLRFTIPTVVNGRVYVEAKGEVDVYGLVGK